MNKIYKVIWSKAKHTYVVASEIAKGHTKGETTGRGLKKLAAAMLVAAALLSPNFAWAADPTVTVTDASNTQQTMYTKDGADNTFVKKGSNNGNSLTIGVSESEILSTHQYVSGAQTTYDGLNGQVVTQATGGNSSISLKVGNSGDLNYNFQNYSEVTTTKDGGTTFTYHYEGGAQTIDNKTTIKGNTVTTGRVTASNGVVDGTTTEGVSVKTTNTVGQNLSALDDRITAVKEYVLKETGDNYVSKADAAVQDGAIVKADKTIGENVTNLDAALAKETAARLGADAAQDKVIKQVNDNLVASVNTINKNVADGFTALNQADANEAAAREAKDNELNERITNEANEIHKTTNKLQSDLNTETAAREAGDTALDTRITNVKEYLEKQTSDKYVSKTDAAVQDGAIVKAAKTIGENVTNLDAALAKETAARLGADKAQDEVIQQVNQNMVDGFNTINKNMADGFTALNQADANELAGRMAADTKLVEATNGGLSLDNDNVLQKTKTEISSTGEVTTSKEAATTLILNKGAANQVKIDSEGVTVGTSSTQMDSEGFTAGGHDYDAAGAALMSDGRIKGAKGNFTVDENGNVASKATITGETVTDGKGASMSNGTVTGKTLTDGIATITNGNINTSGTITGGTVTSMGNISALGDIHAGGAITGASASIQGALTAGSATITGDLTAGGAIQGKSISDGTATMQNGNLTGVKNLSAETITTSGDATIGGDLTVKGKLNVDEIDLTKSGIVGDNNVTASTKVAAGEITSYKYAKSTKDGSEKESAIDYDENGTSTWAKATDADGNWKKSTLTVEGSDVTSKVIDSDKNSNISTQTASESNSSITGTVDGKNYKSYITQNLKNILQGIKEGTNESIVDQTETGIKSTATDGKNTASTNLSNKGFNTYATDGINRTYTLQTAESLTSQIGDDGKVKSVMKADGITNNADGGTITNSAKDLVNKATGDMTNTVGGKLLNDVTGDMENKVGGNLTTTVSGTSTETVTGKKTETYNGGLETTVTGEEKHTVNGSQTNSITGDQVNTIGGKQTTTVTGDVTEDYKANLSTTVGGSQTTTVTGDSSLTAENINNTATNKITNKALDVETEAKSSIMNKVSNDYGSNTSTQLSYETKEEMSQADGKTASYLRGAAEEKSQLIDGGKKTTIDTIAGQTNTNITDGTNTSNDLQKADQIASSVTDGTNTTVVNQDAKSLASSITDGTKANNSSNTVDKSEQLIKASDTQYSATSKTATKMEDALVSGGSVIDVIKNLDDAANPLISSAVTDGTNSTGVTQTAKDITNTAEKGTIANNAKDITNNATENMTNTVGKNLETTVGGEMKTTVTGNVTEDFKADLSTTVGGNKSETVTGTSMETVTRKKTENYNGGLETTVTGDEKHTVNGNQSNTVKGTLTETVTGDVTEDYKANLSTKVGGNQTTTVTGDSSLSAKNITNTATEKLSNSAAEIENSASKSITDKVGDNVSRTMTTSQIKESVVDGANSNTSTKTGSKDMNIVTDGTSTSTLSQLAGSVNTSLKEVDAKKTTKSLSNVKTVSEDTTKITDTTSGAFSSSSQKADSITSTVKDTEKGTISERSQTVSQVQDKVGTTTVTTTDGLTKLTNEAGTHKTQMDFAEVLKDLGVRGNAVVDGTSTLKGDVTMESNASVGKNLTVKGDTTMEGNASVGKDLTVAGTSTLTGVVTMKSNATVEKDLTVNGKSTLKGGLEVTNGTTTDTLKVTGSSEFDGAATFNDIVTMSKGLSVTGGVTADTVTAGTVTADSYKVGDKTYIDKDGINANNQVIRNVGKGDISEGSTDAVSGGQLYETNTRVSGLETRMGTVETRVDKLDNKIDKVGANAAAMANLHPLEFDEDSKWNVAAAVGSSGSETASAVGVFYRPNENVMVNASAAMGTGENMFGGGVSLRLGHGGNKAKEAQMKAAAAENKELRAKVDDLTARMDALLSVLNPNMSKDFPDVPENHWAYEAVSRLAGNGIVEGYEDGKYHGERQMTRYEMAEIIYNALSKGAKAEKKLVEEFRPELQAMAAQKKA